MSFLCRFYVISSILKKHINYCNTTIYNVSYVECHLKLRNLQINYQKVIPIVYNLSYVLIYFLKIFINSEIIRTFANVLWYNPKPKARYER